MNLHIIGLGGIGSHLLLPLLQYLNFEENKFETVLFIDGDSYESKNIKRQFVTELNRNKAIAQVSHFKEMFTDINMMYFDRYINKENINKIIQSGDTVLLCVDNHATRKLLEDFADTVENLTVISGGNELTDGNVMVLQRKDNKWNTPKFSEMHAELKEPKDKSPDDMSCEELAESSPQISIVNAAMADMMRQILYAMLDEGIGYYEVFINCKTASNKYRRFENEDVMKPKRIMV